MVKQLFTVDTAALSHLDAPTRQATLSALESGQVVFLPGSFYSSKEGLERELLSDAILR